MQGSLSIERMCQLAGVSRAGFYRSLQEEMPAEEDMEVRSAIQSSARSKDLAAPAIDLPLKDTYHLRQWPPPSNPWGRRFPITVSCAKSAVGAWVWCTRRKT
jgi:hypothetical protein